MLVEVQPSQADTRVENASHGLETYEPRITVIILCLNEKVF